MEIFWRLVLGHLIADFMLQTNYVAAWKRRNVWGLLVHCGIHPIIYTALLWQYVGQVWLRVGPLSLTGCSCITLIFITHFVEDRWRIWSVLRKESLDNTIFYLWDQMVHVAVLFAVSPVVDGSPSKFGLFHYPALTGILDFSQTLGLTLWERFFTVVRYENWVFLGILFLIVGHFTTVTIYFIEKDSFGGGYPKIQEKYISMVERLIVMGCFLLPGIWWVSVVGVWLLRCFLYKVFRVDNTSWISILVGNGTAILCGILARSLPYS